MSEEAKPGEKPVTIKKYANRRLYNTATSSYVTLDDLAEMVKQGVDFAVFDAKTGDDITRSVLTQIIFEEESKGQNLLPIRFLRQLIRFYGDSMQALVPRYLEFSIEALTQEQEKLRKQLAQAFGGDPFRAMEEQAKHNIAMFEKAMAVFNPFAAAGNPPDASSRERKASSSQPDNNNRPPEATQNELKALRDQLAVMQKQIDALARGKK